MGNLAKIEAGKNSSDAFSGCAPLDWIKEKASDFAEWVSKGIFDMGKQLVKNVKNFFSQDFSWLKNMIGDATNKILDFIPGARFVQKSYGLMIGIGKTIVNEGGACIRAALVGVGIAGAIAGGAAAISALGGLGAVLGGIAVVGVIGATARWFLRGFQRAWNFNWNISDKEIKERYKASLRNISGRLGGLVGTSLATLLCGVTPGAAITAINPLALALVKETVEDGWQEIKGQLTALIQTTAAAAQEFIVLESFKAIRTLVKRAALTPGIKALLPKPVQMAIDNWGKEGSKPWSFASAVEDKIENIKNPNLQAFTEEAVEEFMDVCSEQTYALTYAF